MELAASVAPVCPQLRAPGLRSSRSFRLRAVCHLPQADAQSRPHETRPAIVTLSSYISLPGRASLFFQSRMAPAAGVRPARFIQRKM